MQPEESAPGSEGRKCGMKGHHAVMGQVSDVFTEDTETETFLLGSVAVQDSNKSWPATLHIQDSDVEFQIDSGADASVISQHTYDPLRTSSHKHCWIFQQAG